MNLLQQPQLWREASIALELASLVRDPILRGEGVRHGGGQPVLLVPGFLAGDGSLATMTRWLRRTGHHTRKAGMRVNVDCSTAVADRLEIRLEELAERQGQRVAIVGQSRGGHFARVLSVRRPDLVSGIVCLGSPQMDPFAINAVVAAAVFGVGLAGTIGGRGLFRAQCLLGGCCESFWEDFEAPFPEEVGYVSVYSKRDGVVDWHSCLDPAADHVEIRASHCGMAVSRGAFAAVAEALDTFRRQDARGTKKRSRPRAVRGASRRAA